MCVLYSVRRQTCVLYYCCIYANVEDIWFDGMRCPLLAMQSERLIWDNLFQRNTLLLSTILPFKSSAALTDPPFRLEPFWYFRGVRESMNQSSSGHHSDSVIVVVAAQQKLEGRLGLEHLSPAAARLHGSQLHCRQADRHKNLQPCKMKMSGKRSATFLFFVRLHLNGCVREK